MVLTRIPGVEVLIPGRNGANECPRVMLMRNLSYSADKPGFG